MRAIVTTMEELECSRRKLADNLERNVKHEVTSLYSTTDYQSCRTIKESKKSLDKIAGLQISRVLYINYRYINLNFIDEHEDKLLKYLSLPKSKQEELRECHNGLKHYRKQFKTLGMFSSLREALFYLLQCFFVIIDNNLFRV